MFFALLESLGDYVSVCVRLRASLYFCCVGAVLVCLVSCCRVLVSVVGPACVLMCFCMCRCVPMCSSVFLCVSLCFPLCWLSVGVF